MRSFAVLCLLLAAAVLTHAARVPVPVVEDPVIDDSVTGGDTTNPTPAQQAEFNTLTRCGVAKEGECTRAYESCAGTSRLPTDPSAVGCAANEECCLPRQPFNPANMRVHASGAAIVGTGSKCGAAQSGTCQDREESCAGYTQSGLCPSSALTCCLATASPVSFSELHSAVDEGVDEAIMLPSAGQACGVGNHGVCTAQQKWCVAPKHIQAGGCAGASWCCMPAGSAAVAPAASHAAVPTPAAPAQAPAAAAGGVCPKAATMAAIAFRHALAKSKGACAKYVGDAIQGAGVHYVRTNFARNTGPQLLAAGFRLLPVGARLQPGDVRVVQPIPGHPAGHMEMYTGAPGGLWCSDFKQRDEWPGGLWRNNAAAMRFATYRLAC